MELIFGAVTGLIFGVLLQKSEVLRFDRQVGFLLLEDATIIKFMFSAIVVGAIGMYLAEGYGLIEFQIKPATLVPVALGGLIFGLGWALAGFCPGTALGALGEGRVHALFAILGMLVGAGTYAETRHLLKWKFLKLYNFGTVTLPQFAKINHWLVIAALAAIALILFFMIEKKK